MVLSLSMDDKKVPATVISASDSEITVDYNHPLAGKPLSVRLKIHEVRDATPEDALNSGIHAVSRMMN